MIYDTVIIGAGPAGAHLSYLLAKAGANVALIDRVTFPRDKLCGGLLTYKTLKILWSSYPEKNFSGYEIRTTDVFYKDDLAASFRLLSPVCTVNRNYFDGTLVNYSKKEGTHTYFGSGISSVDFKKREVRLKNGNILKYANLVGADGALSRLRYLAGLQRNQLGFCMEAYIPWEQINDSIKLREGSIEIHYDSYISGYGWVFPRQDKVVVGVGNISNGKPTEEIYDSFYSFLGKVAHPEGLKPRGAYLPSGNSIILGNPNYENMCLIGDAAGLIDPFTGEGIYYALLSAEIVASAILSGSTLYFDYQKRMQQELNQIHENVRVRDELYSPSALRSAISAMQSVPAYSETLIDEVIIRYIRSYKTAYDDISFYMR